MTYPGIVPPARHLDRPAATTVLELKEVGRDFGETRQRVLSQVNLRVVEGDYLAVVGPSGSGKSTLLNLLGLLDRPTTGDYLFEGIWTGSLSEGQLAAVRARRIGFVFQDFHLMPHRSAVENVMLGMLYAHRSRAARRQDAVTALQSVGLEHRLEATPTTLSGGERQRVAIARALAARPAVLLCDEPTGNLDSATAAQVLDLLDDLHANGTTIIVITHDMATAARADRTLTLIDGQLTGDRPDSPTEHTPGVQSPPRPAKRVSLSALADEALAGITQRPIRTALTALGSVIGIGTLVTVLGLTTTAAGQISEAFTIWDATEVRVVDTGARSDAEGFNSFPPDADERAERLNGVLAAGRTWPIVQGSGEAMVAATSLDPRVPTSRIEVNAASPGYLRAVGASFSSGRGFDEFHRPLRVAVLGPGAAQTLGVSTTQARPTVFLAGTGYTVVGILADVRRDPQILSSVIIPDQAALALYGLPSPASPARMTVATQVGAADQVSTEVARAVRPDLPSALLVEPVPQPPRVGSTVSRTLSSLFLVLAAVTLLIGAAGIANTTLVSVIERTSEIGLRRAVGASRIDIATQFLLESALIGGLGGLVGTAIGNGLVVVTAVVQGWTVLINPWTTLTAPALGALVGLAAGLYPALRAANVQPAQALRR